MPYRELTTQAVHRPPNRGRSNLLGDKQISLQHKWALILMVFGCLTPLVVIGLLRLRLLQRELSGGQEKLEGLTEQSISHLSELSPVTAFATEGHRLERYLEWIRETPGGTKWVVAKFVAKKMAIAFEDLEIDMTARKYSVFARELFPECQRSIFLTCPYKIETWMRQLGKEQLAKLKCGDVSGAAPRRPPHEEILDNLTVTKRRLVILDEEDWKYQLGLDQYSESKHRILQLELVKQFEAWNGPGMEVRFVRSEELQSEFGYGEEECLGFDYACLDNLLVLKWRRRSCSGVPTEVTESLASPLILQRAQDHRTASRYAYPWELGDDAIFHSLGMSLKDVRERLESARAGEISGMGGRKRVVSVKRDGRQESLGE